MPMSCRSPLVISSSTRRSGRATASARFVCAEEPLAYRSAREAVHADGGTNFAPIYIAVAEAHGFGMISRL